MGINNEPSFYSLTLGQIWKEREKVKQGYYSSWLKEIDKEKEPQRLVDDDGNMIGD